MDISAASLGDACWRKSRYSGKQGNCVELASTPDARVAVRNSRFPGESTLFLSRAQLAALLSEVKAGRFDDLLLSA